MEHKENEDKVAEAALIAAKAFDRLVTVIAKMVEREYPEKPRP